MPDRRERAPQEVTPVRVGAAARPGAAAGDASAVRPLALPPVAPRRGAADPAGAGAAPGGDPEPSMEELEAEVRRLRRRLLATTFYGAGAFTTFVLGAASHFGPLLVASAFCGMATLAGTAWTARVAMRLHDAGVRVRDTFGGRWRDRVVPRRGTAATARVVGPAALPPGSLDAAAALVEPAVLASAHGDAVRRAVDDRAAIADMVARLGPADRAMIPDVLPTVETLVHRVAELATSLQRVDRDAPGRLLPDVEARLAEARRAAEDTPDRERRIELLERQGATLRDLVHRRDVLAARLENAGLLLQNIRLDLLRLTSGGIDTSIGELSTATREASALSTEIGRALDVAGEMGEKG